jgi:2-polyprenyl-6-methoxyphenol hydroxylase-like FAD-dependent oxidoreductase
MAPAYSDVLIIGAGPSGLFAASELARHGVRARIIEQADKSHRQTRATAIQPATLELFARAGLVETFLRLGVKIKRVRVLGEGFQQISVSDLEDLDSPFPFECSLPQWQTEKLLAEHLSGFGVEVERGLMASSIEATEDGALVAITKTDGSVEVAQARYLVGAGGAHSVTRHAMGQQLEGETYRGKFMAADVCLRLLEPADEVRLFISAAGSVLVAPLPEGRYLLIMDSDSSSDENRNPDACFLDAELERRAGASLDVHDVQWTSNFVMHKRIVERLAGKNWFLLGDAAHLSSVFGGEGLNAGLMDAADLAWKLATVIKGAGRCILLDSYEAERTIADHHAMITSDRIHGNVANLVQAFSDGSYVAQDGIDAEEDKEFKRRRCMLDVSYAGSALVGEHSFNEAPWPTGPVPGERYPDRVRLTGRTHKIVTFGGKNAALDSFVARWSELADIVYGAEAGLNPVRAGVPSGGAILMRPDGFIGFRVDMADAHGICAIEKHLLTYLQPQRGN